jgi:energy-coupling factor transporter ATP-binding protein EcfA2
MIAIDNVSYWYPNADAPVLQDLALTIDEGEFVVVCGPSGSGKSTLLRLLNGLVPHFHGGRFGGDVRVWGRSTRAHQPRDLADLVGFVFQDPEAQFVVDMVEDEIVFAMENLGLAPRLMRRRVEEVLDQLGIAHLRRRRISSLSGGEQQRVAIAAVLAAQPRALVLDEPTSQLDPHAAEEVLTALQKLNDDLGLTVVLSEHRLERVVQYADRVLVFTTTDDRRMTTGAEAFVHGPASISIGPPREVLAHVETAPPLVQLGRALGWTPLPLTIKEGRRFAASTQYAVRSSQFADERSAEAAHPPTRSPAPTISVERVHFAYGEHEALYDVSMAAHAGEVLALMGRNGSGKTTLLKLLTGLLKPQHGSVRVLGRDVTRMDVEEVAAFVGYVPQNPHRLLFHDTLREELEFTLTGRRTTDGQRKKLMTAPDQPSIVHDTLARFGIAHLADAYPRDLSGGEAQRAALAAIAVGDPAVLLLDEPTRGLDYAAKAALGRQLRQLAAQGRTIIMATHDVELVAAHADRVLLLGDGEVVVDGPVREVLSDSLIFSSQTAKLFPGSGWLTVEDALRHAGGAHAPPASAS